MNGEASVGLPRQNLPLLAGLSEAVVGGLDADGDGTGVEVADVEGLADGRPQEDSADLDDDWSDCDVAEFVGGELAAD